MTAAAASLHLSQPRISAHIAALENLTGAPLFERGARGVTLTPLGERFVRRARKVFEELRAAADDLDAARDRIAGRLRIGSYPGATAVLVAPLLAEFRTRHPAVEVELFDADAARLDRAVSRGKVDFAVRAAGPPRAAGLPATPLCQEKIVALVPSGDATRDGALGSDAHDVAYGVAPGGGSRGNRGGAGGSDASDVTPDGGGNRGVPGSDTGGDIRDVASGGGDGAGGPGGGARGGRGGVSGGGGRGGAAGGLGFLTGATVIVSGDPQGGWADYRDRLTEVGVEPGRVMVAAMPTTVAAFVRAGLGIGILGAFAAYAVNAAGTTTLDLPAPLWRRDVRVIRPEGDLGAPARAFIRLLRRHGPSLTDGLAVW